MNARTLVSRAYEALPRGTGPVSIGLVVGAVTSYAFVVVSLNALTGATAAAFSAYWAVLFVAGPGFFIPLEQEVGRALARRRAQNIGSRPIVMRASLIGAVITTSLVVLSLMATPLLKDRIYHGDLLFMLALPVGLISFYLTHLMRGTLSGEGRFGAYGGLMASEGIIRLVGAGVLAGLGINRAGAYALVLAISPLFALLIALPSARAGLRSGPVAPWKELSASLGWLLLASVLTQLLAYSPLLIINIGSNAHEKVLAGAFASAFFVARVPVLSFQAVQGTLLPQLAGFAGSGKHGEFRRGISRLLLLVVAVGFVGTVGALVIGPRVGSILFANFALSARGLALLTAASCTFMLALTLAQALMALGKLRGLVFAWAVGVLVAAMAAVKIAPLELRAELSALLGSLAAAVAMGLVAWRSLDAMDDAGIEPLIEAIEQESSTS